MEQPKHTYLVISRGQWDEQASREDVQHAIDRFYGWYEGHLACGRMLPGRRFAQARQSMLVGIEVIKPRLQAVHTPDQQIELGGKQGAGRGRRAQGQSPSPCRDASSQVQQLAQRRKIKHPRRGRIGQAAQHGAKAARTGLAGHRAWQRYVRRRRIRFERRRLRAPIHDRGAAQHATAGRR